MRHVLRLDLQVAHLPALASTTNQWNEDDKINYSHATRAPAAGRSALRRRAARSPARARGSPGGVAAPRSSPDSRDRSAERLPRERSAARRARAPANASAAATCGSAASWRCSAARPSPTPSATRATRSPSSSPRSPTTRKLVDEIFTRVLNRPATDGEIARTLRIVGRHRRRARRRSSPHSDAKEKEQAPIIAKVEADRVAAIDAAKKELARYEAEIAPKVAEAEKKRVADVAVPRRRGEGLREEEARGGAGEVRGDGPGRAHLHRLAAARSRRSQGDRRRRRSTKQPDGSIKASGPAAKQYGLHRAPPTPRSPASPASCSRCCRAADEPAFGPGRSGGNFVLGEFA